MINFVKIEFRKKRDFGEVLGATFSFIKQNAKNLFKAILFIVGPPVLIGAFLMGSFMSNMFSQVSSGVAPQALGFISLLIGFLLVVSGFMLCTSVILSYIKLYNETETGVITVSDVWNEAISHVFSLLSLGFLVVIATMLGMVLCFVPGFYLAIALSFSVLILVIEGKGISDSFSRSYRLISGHWWSTFGVMFVMNMITSILSYVIIIPMYVLIAVIFITNGTGNYAENMQGLGYIMMFYMPIMYLGIAFLSSLQLITLAFQYFSVVEEKESVGIMSEISKLEEENRNY